jgi:predicted dehydrogenase
MIREKAFIGFIGAGGIARAHAFALNSLPYYYNDPPEIVTWAVCSSTSESRDKFASQFGFLKSVPLDDFVLNEKINTVYIFGPNNTHAEHFQTVLKMPSVTRIYIEKPLCSTFDEERYFAKIADENTGIKVQTGFQFLFMPSIREALALWNSGKFGKPVHFDFKYYHGDYLRKEYRDKRKTRLTPSPGGGAMADLGSHAISLLIAFLGDQLQITNALQSGQFPDVTAGSDLYSLISLFDPKSAAAGTLSASRISSGTGDLLSMELYAENGTIRFSSHTPDYFEFFLEETGSWTRVPTGSNFNPITSFPSGHVPPGWLRSMIHAHYVFLTGNDPGSFVPDLQHGLEVQRLVRETADHLAGFRKSVWKL